MARRPEGAPRPRERGVYIISVAAELAGVHPQTLRMYERKGLLSPRRTAGNSRRYSQSDVDQLRRIQRLTQDEGVNLAGVRIIMELEEQLNEMRRQLERARRRMAEAQLRTSEASRRSSWGALVRLTDVRNIFDR